MCNNTIQHAEGSVVQSRRTIESGKGNRGGGCPFPSICKFLILTTLSYWIGMICVCFLFVENLYGVCFEFRRESFFCFDVRIIYLYWWWWDCRLIFEKVRQNAIATVIVRLHAWKELNALAMNNHVISSLLYYDLMML